LGCVPLTTLLFNLTRLLIVYIIPVSYCISHDSDISDQVRNKNKGAYPSNSIRFSVAMRWFFSKCFSPPTPDSFSFTHSVSIPSFLYTQLHASALTSLLVVRLSYRNGQILCLDPDKHNQHSKTHTLMGLSFLP